MNKKSESLIFAILMIVLGVLFIAFKSNIIGITMTVFGVALIVSAIIDLIQKNVVPGVIKAVVGVVVIVFGWAFVSVALYIMAALILIYGILCLYQTIKSNKTMDKRSKIINYVDSILFIVIGLCLLFNQGGTISLVFIIAGVFLIINGILALLQCLPTNTSNKNN